MSKDKEIINKLFKVVAQQQQIITKLAQQSVGNAPAAVTPPPSAAQVQADLVDALYGKGAKMIPGKTYPQVYYAKSDAGKLVIGVSIPPTVAQKWEAMKLSLGRILSSKYGAGEVIWKE